MKRTCVLFLLTGALVACGEGGDGAGAGACVNISGSWSITEHCIPSMVGSPATVTQSGCAITTDWGGSAPATGTIHPDGTLDMNVDTGGGQFMRCVGESGHNGFRMVCRPGDCAVTLKRR